MRAVPKKEGDTMAQPIPPNQFFEGFRVRHVPVQELATVELPGKFREVCEAVGVYNEWAKDVGPAISRCDTRGLLAYQIELEAALNKRLGERS